MHGIICQMVLDWPFSMGINKYHDIFEKEILFHKIKIEYHWRFSSLTNIFPI